MYDHYTGLPQEDTLFNPLVDVPAKLKERDELTEIYKLCNEYYSPEFGIKYLLNTNLYPFQMATIRAILAHKFPLILFTRGGGKTFMLAVYAVYHAIMYPGSRIVLVSASFRQSKLIFAEIQRMWERSPLLQMIATDKPRISTDNCHFDLVGSTIKALPLGTGDKIRGERGHVILADEFNSIPIEVFDIVVRGFAATESDPWTKTRDRLLRAQREGSADLPQDHEMANAMISEGNKIILSGTAGFKGGTFYQIFKQYSTIISNGIHGRVEDYEALFEDCEIDSNIDIDCSDYCICRYTYQELPLGMQDVKLIENAKATMPLPLFKMEYMAQFADDTFGFFKPRDIEAATSKSPGGFGIVLKGSENRHYIMGVDPARTVDRFAIVVIELGQPNKVVYCWTAQNKPYSFGASKMRELMRHFNIIGIGIDPQGGGFAVEELINKSDVMKDKEKKIYPFDDDKPESQTGLKILYPFNFTSNWVDDANALLQKNIEDRVLMFPMAVDMSGSEKETFVAKDDVCYEILEMKKELIAIEVSHTKTGRKHFDLAPPDPTKDIDGIIKHKDRYSALLLANYLATRMNVLNYDEKEMARNIYYDTFKHFGWSNDLIKRLDR